MVNKFINRWRQSKKKKGTTAGSRLPSLKSPFIPVNFQTLVEESVDVICQVRHGAGGVLEYVYVSPSSVEVVGWTEQEMKRGKHSMLYPPASMAIIRETRKRLDAGTSMTVVTVEAIRKDGRHIWLENRVRTLAEDTNGNRTVVVCMRDITERKLLQDQLANLVLVDALTGVGNRRAFDAALNREWERAVEQQAALSLMLIDVDFFKKINDTYGHQVGDDCIRLVAQKLCQLLDRPEAFIARYGGDELAVLLPGIDQTEAANLGSGFCRAIAAAALLPAGDAPNAPSITISCGVTTVRGQSDGSSKRDGRKMPAGLITAADRALYAAKCLGRNQAVVELA